MAPGDSTLVIEDEERLSALIDRDALEALDKEGLQVRLELSARSPRPGAPEGPDVRARFDRARQELAQRRDRLQVKMAALGLVGAGIAHEVRNVMTGVLGFAQVAHKKWDQRDEAKELVSAIERESVRCVEVLNNFLHFTRGRDKAQGAVDLVEVLRSVAQVVRHQAQLRGVEVVLDAPRAPAVDGHAGELRQVVLNLVLNAIQATGRGGKVRLGVRAEPGAAIIEVADTGQGISPSDQRKLFTPFFTTKPADKGTGLGLYVCRGIVQDHGGTIGVASALGAGTTFTVRLPAGRRPR
jgi:signal transduction histidine kinase